MAELIAAVMATILGLFAGRLSGRLVARFAGDEPRILHRAVELAMALSWAAVLIAFGRSLPWAVPAFLVLAFYCVTLAAIDAVTRKLPNRLTYSAFAAVFALLVLASAGESDFHRLLSALTAAAIVGCLFLLLAVAVPGGMGLGDVKLAPTFALALGWVSWSAVLEGFCAAFLLAGVAGVVAMTAMHRSRRDTLPFGPWLALGAMVALLVAGLLSAATLPAGPVGWV